MARNFKIVPVQCVPTGLTRRTTRYIAREAIPGFSVMRGASDTQYVFQLPPDDGAGLAETPVSSTAEGFTDVVKINKAAGGVIDSWTVVDEDTQDEIQFLARMGRTGRQQQVDWFPVDEHGGNNPTMGGSQYGGTPIGGDPDNENNPASVYTDGDVVQGSPCIGFNTDTSIDGSRVISVDTVPFDFAATDHTHTVTALYKNDPHRAIAYADHTLGYDLTLDLHGVKGLHRWDGRITFLEPIGQDMTAAHHHNVCHMRFGFDKVYHVYIQPDATLTNDPPTRLDDELIYDEIDGESITAWTETVGLEDVTLAIGTHGRTVGTQHLVTIAGATGTDADLVNTTHYATFVSSTEIQITLADPITTEDLSGGTASSTPIKYHDWTSTAQRVMWVGNINIGSAGGDSDHDIGSFPGKSLASVAGYHALIFRADGTEAWSMADEFGGDFAVAVVGYITDYLHAGRVLNLIEWRNHMSGATTPTNGEEDDPTTLYALNEAWVFGSTGLSHAAGVRKWTSYILTGKYDDVVANLDVLRGMIVDGTEHPIQPPSVVST